MSETGVVQLCTLRVDGSWFAVDIMRVREITTVARVTPTPGGGPDGAVEVRGELVPMFDLRRRLGLPALPDARGPRVVVLAIGDARIAVLVDRVTEVVKVPSAEIKALPRVESSSLIAGAVRHQGRVLLLLDVKGLVLARPGRRRKAPARKRARG